MLDIRYSFKKKGSHNFCGMTNVETSKKTNFKQKYSYEKVHLNFMLDIHCLCL
jgi:hypothetical protein